MLKEESYKINLWGHSAVLHSLQEAYKQDRLMPVYLFWGEKGVGKSTAALWLAQLVNCQSPADSSPCGACSSCRKIFKLVHPDLRIIAPVNDEIHIEQIRAMQEEAKLLPLEGKRKVYIIVEAHKLNNFASNSLLKILEEPPSGLLLVLTADSPAHLLPTIVSRSAQIKFSLLQNEELKKFLATHIDDEEKIKLGAKLAQGKPGKALEMLKDANFEASRHKIIKILNTFREKTLAELLEEADKLELDKEANLEILLSWARDLILIKEKVSPDYLVNQDFQAELSHLAEALTLWQCYQIGLIVKETRQDIEKPLNLNKKFIILRMLTSLSSVLE
jgi:DNA polymerase-3 subunit delta'